MAALMFVMAMVVGVAVAMPQSDSWVKASAADTCFDQADCQNCDWTNWDWVTTTGAYANCNRCIKCYEPLCASTQDRALKTACAAHNACQNEQTWDSWYTCFCRQAPNNPNCQYRK